MSRSYKKHPFYTDGVCGTTKRKKKQANHRVRNTDDIPQRGGYKKIYPSYDIHDYINRWTWEQALRDWEHGEYGNNEALRQLFPTLKEFYRYWFKTSRAK